MAWYSASFTSGHTKNIKDSSEHSEATLFWNIRFQKRPWHCPLADFKEQEPQLTIYVLWSYGKQGWEWVRLGVGREFWNLSPSLSLSPALPITPLPIMCYHVLSVLEEHETFSMITCWIANSCNSGGEKYWKNCGVRHTMAKSLLPGSNPASSCIHASFSKVARTQPTNLSRWNRMNMMKGYICIIYICIIYIYHYYDIIINHISEFHAWSSHMEPRPTRLVST